MIEQDRIGFIYQSLGKKDTPELIAKIGERLREELTRGTTQMDIKIGEEVRLGIPKPVSERQKPGYARKVEGSKINIDSITYDGFGHIVVTIGQVKFDELLIVGGKVEAQNLKDLIERSGEEVLIDIAAAHYFEIRDEKTGRILFSHPEGKKDWIEILPPPYLGVWTKRKD